MIKLVKKETLNEVEQRKLSCHSVCHSRSFGA